MHNSPKMPEPSLAVMPDPVKLSFKPSMQFCAETRNRIRVAVAAYAYEIENDPVMSDAEFDTLAQSIRPTTQTGNTVMDYFFLTSFNPDTGQWVHRHPDRAGLQRLLRFYRVRSPRH